MTRARFRMVSTPARVLSVAVIVAGLVVGGFAWDTAFAQPPWSDNFDSYVAGSQIIGQGGWKGWDSNPAVGALVTSLYARSSPNSVAITGATDLVHEYVGYTSGRAVYTAWQYVPNTFSGTTYFILLNEYADGGPNNWSVQVHFESGSGRVVSDFDGNWLPLIRGRWVQIRVEINLDTDTQTFYYDNTPLYTKSWRCGVVGCGPLPPNIAAVDLYANGASPVYYDDMSLAHAAPALGLAKSITSGSPYSAVGSTVQYSYTLTNTGNVTLYAPYAVTDDYAAVSCPAVPASLVPGASVICTASYTITQADLDAGSVTNTATATARDAATGGNSVTSNPDSKTATATQSPALTIVKTASPGSYDAVGDVISYSYEVGNSGNVTLSGPFTVSDDRATDEFCPATASLAPGASITCSASYTILQADLDAGSVSNTASASGGFGGNPVTSPTDEETVAATQMPELTLTKSITAGDPYSAVGDVVSYAFDVENTGNVRIDGPVTVADDRASDEFCPDVDTVGNLDAFLDSGEILTCSASYSITQADLDAGSVTNTATASGTFAGSPVTSLPDDETATASQSPELTLVKAASPTTYGAAGELIDYGYLVANSGNVTVDGPFTVTDDLASDEDCPPTISLAPGASISCTASYTIVDADLIAGSVTNQAFATGAFSGSPVVSNADQATVAAFADPAVTKSGDPATAAIGDTVTFTLVVSNTGPGDAEDVVVVDPIPAFLDPASISISPVNPAITIGISGNTITFNFGTLPAGDSYTITIRTVANALATPPGGTNTATLTTTSPDSDPDNNTDSALVTIVVRPPSTAPETGFAPGRATLLPVQPAFATYTELGDLWLEIPALGVRRAITGVPRQAGGWDVTWLGNLAGYLEGTAFPTWIGNSVITGHVVVASGLPGPFARLGQLSFGDSVIVHAWGEQYRYEVRQASVLSPNDPSIFRHEERAWLTLLTCQDFDPTSETYRTRQVVRAVLMEIDGEFVMPAPQTRLGH